MTTFALANLLSDIEHVRSTLDYDPDSAPSPEDIRGLLGRVKFQCEQLLEVVYAFREPTEIKITPNPESEPVHGEWFDRYRVTLQLQIGDLEPLMRLLVPDAFEDM